MAISHPEKIPVSMFTQNFVADLNAGQLVSFPWTSTTERNNLSPGQNTCILCPCDMTFRNLSLRVESMTVTGDVTIAVHKLVEGLGGAASIVEIDSTTFEINKDTDDYATFNLDKSDISATALKGELLYVSIEPVLDMGSSKDWFITSVWEIPKYKE